MKIIPKFDLRTIQNIIGADFSDIKIDSIQLIEHGWDNVVVEVNRDWIFRFPKDDAVRFDVELKVLDIFKDRISLRIPKVEFLGKSFTYMGYRKILGSDLTAEIISSLNSDQKEKLIFDLANFLREVHAALTPAQASKLGVADEDLLSYSRLVESVLPHRISDSAVLDFTAATLGEYQHLVQEKTESVFLYNDLHTENIVFDAASKKLNGIFDFGDVLVGDVNMDFYALYKFDPCFMKAVAEKYQELTGRTLNLRRVVIYGRITELCDLAETIDKPESTVYKNALMRIGKWRKEMDLCKDDVF